MLFSSNVFLFAFLPSVLIVYYLSPRCLRNPVLLLFSLFFYGWGEPVYLLLMIGVIILNYIFGLLISSAKEQGKSAKPALIAAVIGNLLILGYFKYTSFVMEGLSALIPMMSKIRVPEISLPIGISFYVFQSMSYVIDVYREDTTAQKNVLTFGTYVALFPQLIAGPIVRYRDVAQQMVSRKESVSAFASGIIRFSIGLGKKVLLANPMGNMWNLLQSQPGTLAAWIGLIAYTMQIYFDFSGYSDMAIGLGRMFGFEFMENFNYPYISRSITEFWRRWHISLSSWFREYVYIPLGGNRCRTPRHIFNMAVVWMLTGIWHGASWNFVLWGLYYVFWLIIEKYLLLGIIEKLPPVFRHIYAMAIVTLGWALFYFEDMSALGCFLTKLFTFNACTNEALNIISAYLPLMLVTIIACTPLPKRLLGRYADAPVLAYVKTFAAMIMLMLCVAALASQSYNPFIYFRF